uniref:Uncharacterized protein n=1 Tax=Candidatus Kentrum sp. MB TaxID=2138164 RepID=A0A451B9V5_9GAMM|nr:MAG: hypothetical protein BECKMB1821G_GA0114241_10165 [Candidatus Kentron sp. MB]VFK27147.1 MAG: hypothetical protein BECKMB1821I_GA0114274_100256 [Candidatus Kentron sp. MB]VFK75068.1 MAG: hypothetical protein BECKMB1821H_GA0114242_10155 [Candidatus Kentron sp. MB]
MFAYGDRSISRIWLRLGVSTSRGIRGSTEKHEEFLSTEITEGERLFATEDTEKKEKKWRFSLLYPPNLSSVVKNLYSFREFRGHSLLWLRLGCAMILPVNQDIIAVFMAR